MTSAEEKSNLDQITERILGCAYKVSNAHGCGFNEKVYENSLALELQFEGLKVHQQVPFDVMYRGQVVGHYVADMVVEGCVLVELKALDSLVPVHVAQCLNYLKASGLKLCLLLNFGKPKVEVKRIAS
ncbi:MAG: GxxExxY protein [Planctomycetes bacterium]|nr:GxxExxY protein [Planctomycetota bacterium]